MNRDAVRKIKKCRSCGSEHLATILSFGEMYVSDFVDKKSEGEKFPLELVLCSPVRGGCGLVQLRHTVPQESLYRNYWYRSGTNKTMTDALEGIAQKVESLVNLAPGDAVIDIGANDGTLLRGYRANGIVRVGFEPARNLEELNRVGTSIIINDFFAWAPWHAAFPALRAKAVTAIAMFYDLDDPNAFVKDIVKCLDPEGVCIIQMSYLPLMLETNEIGNVCHEHLEYYSLFSLEPLLARNGLEVFDVELNDINGGSFRIYMRHRGKGRTIRVPKGAAERVRAMREEEKKFGLDKKETYDAFAKRAADIKKKVNEFITKAIAAGKKVYAYGASTKGNTLLQYMQLDATLITAAAERNSMKWGKYTVGTMIPIISEEDARRQKPDYFLVLPWHFLPEFIKRESEFLRGGGTFIVPMPEFREVGKE